MFESKVMFEAEKGKTSPLQDAETAPLHVGEELVGTVTPPVTTEEKRFSQADVDQIIKERLEREKRKAAELAEDARKKAEAESAVNNGEWQKLAEQRDADLKKLMADTREKDIRFTALKLGIQDVDYAVYLVMKAGEDADAEAVLKEYTKVPQPSSQPSPTSPSPSVPLPIGDGRSGNPTNPASTGGVFTRSQLRDPAFFSANKSAIMQAAREGRIKDE